jgi:hypothetical protein
VRVELLGMPGVLEVTYQADRDLFAVRFEAVLVSLEAIFAGVFAAGKKMGREYFPEVVPSSIDS